MPISTNQRDQTSHTNERSRRMSVPHASRPIERQLRPSLARGARPSCTRMTTASIVVNSSTPSAIVPSQKLFVATGDRPDREARGVAEDLEQPDQRRREPTCFSGTRSGT